MAVDITPYAQVIVNSVNGQELKLAFVYEDVAYYFAPAAWSDEDSTGLIRDGEPSFGLEANEELRSAILRYGKEGAPVWIAPWFREAVALFLSK